MGGEDDDKPKKVEDDESEGPNEGDSVGKDDAIVWNGFGEEATMELENMTRMLLQRGGGTCDSEHSSPHHDSRR
jgi:hypothetical protein